MSQTPVPAPVTDAIDKIASAANLAVTSVATYYQGQLEDADLRIDLLEGQVETIKLQRDDYAHARDVAQAEVARLTAALADCQGENPPPVEEKLTIIGMSSPDDIWDTRVREVGANGLKARRIFANDKTGTNPAQKMDIVSDAIHDGLLPVFSIKPPSGDAAGVASGKWDTYITRVLDNLVEVAGDKTVSFTYAHEPNPDQTAAAFVAANRRIVALVARYPTIRFGPFLNGWLLDRQLPLFTSYTRDAQGSLLDRWHFMGIDTYEEGTIENPGDIKPASRIPRLRAFVNDQGHPEIPLALGEYNGYSGKSILDVGTAVLEDGGFWFACLWNATAGKGYVLTGERLSAFQATKRDPRVAQ